MRMTSSSYEPNLIRDEGLECSPEVMKTTPSSSIAIQLGWAVSFDLDIEGLEVF